MSSPAKPAMHFVFVTLFPEPIRIWFKTSILGRAVEQGLFTFEVIQLRDFSQDRHRRVDDVPYGGGGGMVLKVEPLAQAAESLRHKYADLKPRTVFFSPRGRRLTQEWVEALHSADTDTRCFILFCGHYEGVDQRFIDHWIDLEVSLGDFVLTGGELPAMAFAETLIRRIDEVLDSSARVEHESFSLKDASGHRLLEYPHYTRPLEFQGLQVPDVLLSGHHGEIQRWRQEQAEQTTRNVRPDLFASD